MKNIFIVAGCALGLSACASSADNIQASYVSPNTYQNYNCAQLQEEAERISSRVQQLTGTQNSNRTKDIVTTTVGVVIFWPLLFANSGDGHTAAELARVKGEAEALERASIQKKCGISFQKAAPQG